MTFNISNRKHSSPQKTLFCLILDELIWWLSSEIFFRLDLFNGGETRIDDERNIKLRFTCCTVHRKCVKWGKCASKIWGILGHLRFGHWRGTPHTPRVHCNLLIHVRVYTEGWRGGGIRAGEGVFRELSVGGGYDVFYKKDWESTVFAGEEEVCFLSHIKYIYSTENWVWLWRKFWVGLELVSIITACHLATSFHRSGWPSSFKQADYNAVTEIIPPGGRGFYASSHPTVLASHVL